MATAAPPRQAPSEERIRNYLEQSFRVDWPTSPAFMALEGEIVNKLFSELVHDVWSLPDEGLLVKTFDGIVGPAADRAMQLARQVIIDELTAGGMAFAERCPAAPLKEHTDAEPPEWEKRLRKSVKQFPEATAAILSGTVADRQARP